MPIFLLLTARTEYSLQSSPTSCLWSCLSSHSLLSCLCIAHLSQKLKIPTHPMNRLALDFALDNSYTSRAQFEIGVFGVLSVFWLAFNAFSSSRWSQVPFYCNSIPSGTHLFHIYYNAIHPSIVKDFPDEITWCKNLQALKSFVWANFLICTSFSSSPPASWLTPHFPLPSRLLHRDPDSAVRRLPIRAR